jgi:triacylglycerol esterase/lipase EstA (alpha/beta hydrolase family)
VFGLFAAGHAIVLGVEFILLVVASRANPAHSAGAGELARAWWGEVVTAPQVFCWHQPFRSRAEPDNLSPAASGRVGILFVHGFVCNRGLWNPWLARLRERGVPFVAVDLEPVFGSIDNYSPIIERAVRRIEAATGRPPLIVAHSMGGLAVRAWLDAYQSDARVHHVVTIGTPHRGTWLANFAFAANVWEMRLDSEWQHALMRREPTARYAMFTCFHSRCDNIVFPISTATLPAADNRQLTGVAHVHMAREEVIFQEILRQATNPV